MYESYLQLRADEIQAERLREAANWRLIREARAARSARSARTPAHRVAAEPDPPGADPRDPPSVERCERLGHELHALIDLARCHGAVAKDQPTQRPARIVIRVG